MKRFICLSLFSVLLLSLFFFTSCSTAKTEYVTEYVPLSVDLSGVIEPVLEKRPDNSVLDIHAGPVMELADVVNNSLQYQRAWEMWQNYATLLEQAILQIQNTYNKVKSGF